MDDDEQNNGPNFDTNNFDNEDIFYNNYDFDLDGCEFDDYQFDMKRDERSEYFEDRYESNSASGSSQQDFGIFEFCKIEDFDQHAMIRLPHDKLIRTLSLIVFCFRQ